MAFLICPRSLSSLWADRWEGGATVKNSSNELVNIRIAYSSVDPEFIDMMEIKTLEGRAFSREMGTG